MKDDIYRKAVVSILVETIKVLRKNRSDERIWTQASLAKDWKVTVRKVGPKLVGTQHGLRSGEMVSYEFSTPALFKSPMIQRASFQGQWLYLGLCHHLRTLDGHSDEAKSSEDIVQPQKVSEVLSFVCSNHDIVLCRLRFRD